MHAGHRGFSLLEVLVAFVILSLVATALFGLFSGALNNASAADDYSRAVLVAESALAEAAAAKPLRETSQTGTADDGRITWKTTVAPYVPPAMPAEFDRAAEPLRLTLYRVTAEVAFPAPSGGERRYELATLRIGPKETR
jgi:general secretion pathway protein I